MPSLTRPSPHQIHASPVHEKTMRQLLLLALVVHLIQCSICSLEKGSGDACAMAADCALIADWKDENM